VAEEVPTFDGFTVLEADAANGQAEVLDDYSHYTSELGIGEADEGFVYDEATLNGNSFSNGNGDFSIVGRNF
jgi:hypothetical protein